MNRKFALRVFLVTGVFFASISQVAVAQECASAFDVSNAYSYLQSAQGEYEIAQGNVQGYWGSQAYLDAELAYSDNYNNCSRVFNYGVQIEECQQQAEENRVLAHQINVGVLEELAMAAERAAYDAQVVYDMIAARPRCPTS